MTKAVSSPLNKPLPTFCGTCAHAKSTPDFMKIVCYGAPPTPIIMGGRPMPGGKVDLQIECMYPILPRSTPSCGFYKEGEGVVTLAGPVSAVPQREDEPQERLSVPIARL